MLIPGSTIGSSVCTVLAAEDLLGRSQARKALMGQLLFYGSVQRELLLQSHLSGCWLNSDPAMPFLFLRCGSQASSTPGDGLRGQSPQ